MLIYTDGKEEVEDGWLMYFGSDLQLLIMVSANNTQFGLPASIYTETHPKSSGCEACGVTYVHYRLAPLILDVHQVFVTCQQVPQLLQVSSYHERPNKMTLLGNNKRYVNRHLCAGTEKII